LSHRAFEEFWKRYPRKVGKLAAKRKWDALNPGPIVIAQIMDTLAWQIEEWTDPRFIPHPATWLFQGRYLDERPAVQAEDSESYLERIGFCFHDPKCKDSDVCRAKRAAEKRA
jgi:hypothetical protein